MSMWDEEDHCTVCGGWDACKSCSEDPYSAPCGYCGDPDCDGTGYNCADGHFSEYNLRGYDKEEAR